MLHRFVTEHLNAPIGTDDFRMLNKCLDDALVPGTDIDAFLSQVSLTHFRWGFNG